MRPIHRHTAAAAAAPRLHGVRSSMVERLIVHQDVVGSSPVARPPPIRWRFTGPARRSDDPAAIGTPIPR